MEINGVQTELSVEEFVKLSEILENKSEEPKEVSGFEIARSLIDAILDEDEEEAVAELAEESVEELPFKVGDKVRVIVPTTEDSQFGWSVVKSGDVGVVNKVFPDKISVTFENQKFWSAHPSELELFDEDADLPAGTTIKSKFSKNVYTIVSRNTSNDDCGLGKAYNKTDGGWLGTKQFEVINVPLAEPTPPEAEHTIEVGDIVQVTEDSWGHPVGTIGVVEAVETSDDVLVSALLDNGEFEVFTESNVKLIAKHYDRKDV
jgi:transcription antitermination factor NusG